MRSLKKNQFKICRHHYYTVIRANNYLQTTIFLFVFSIAHIAACLSDDLDDASAGHGNVYRCALVCRN